MAKEKKTEFSGLFLKYTRRKASWPFILKLIKVVKLFCIFLIKET